MRLLTNISTRLQLIIGEALESYRGEGITETLKIQIKQHTWDVINQLYCSEELDLKTDLDGLKNIDNLCIEIETPDFSSLSVNLYEIERGKR